MSSGKIEFVDIGAGEVGGGTDKGVFIKLDQLDGDRDVFVPYSCMSMPTLGQFTGKGDNHRGLQLHRIRIEAWLADKEGLEGQPDIGRGEIKW